MKQRATLANGLCVEILSYYHERCLTRPKIPLIVYINLEKSIFGSKWQIGECLNCPQSTHKMHDV